MIENVLNYKYLRLVFNASGTWSKAMENLSVRGLKALFLFKNVYLHRGHKSVPWYEIV